MLEYLSREVDQLYPFFEFIPLLQCAQTSQAISFKSFSSFVQKKQGDKIINPLELKVESKVCKITRAAAVVHA